MCHTMLKAAKTLRIATWNINSVRARMPIVEKFLNKYQPDFICLQEIKSTNNDFPTKALAALGYRHMSINGQRMHHGVAILAKTAFTNEQRHDWQANGEARHTGITLTGLAGFDGVRLESVYVPAGGDVADRDANPKFGQKLDFLNRMTDWASTISTPTILVGDLNIAPLPDDVWSHKALLDVVSHTPIEVEALEALQTAHGFIDAMRLIKPAPERLYTWWSYRAADWRGSDRGRRLDHIWISPALKPYLKDCFVVEEARSWDKPSDHAPVIADFVQP
jgi:exodeoxyribonuclease III